MTCTQGARQLTAVDLSPGCCYLVVADDIVIHFDEGRAHYGVGKYPNCLCPEQTVAVLYVSGPIHHILEEPSLPELAKTMSPIGSKVNLIGSLRKWWWSR